MLRWCAKFEAERESPALVWKKGRNQHARALLCGLRSGRLAPPFDAGPRDEPLGAGISSACAAAVGLHRGAQQADGRKQGPNGLRMSPAGPGWAARGALMVVLTVVMVSNCHWNRCLDDV